jgi:ParB/RepB/Spo0J family partition protein
MEVFTISPLKIKVKQGLERYRQDLGDVEGLAESFKRTKQILPIIINRNNELIDGGRRLAAAIMAGLDVKCVYDDAVDECEMRELELEANLFRKDYTPAEYAQGVADLHALKQRKYGETTSGQQGGWTLDNTAKLMGKTRGSVIRALEINDLVHAFPQLKQAKKASEIVKAGKKLNQLTQAMAGMAKHEEIIKSKKTSFKLFQEDAVTHMTTVPDASIDILLTDPIYGINADKTAMNIGRQTGGDLTTSGYRISDSPEEALFYYYVLSKESYRFTTDSAHGYAFVGPEHFWKIRDMFIAAGWRVHVKPLIWIKRSTGQCNVPSAWPSSCYEMIMYFRKDNSRLVKEACPDWIECDPVLQSQRTHPYEKPVPLLNNLLERVCLPGQKLYDPFMGSAASIEAGVWHNLFCIGVDISPEAYAMACSRMAKITEQKAREEGN